MGAPQHLELKSCAPGVITDTIDISSMYIINNPPMARRRRRTRRTRRRSDGDLRLLTRPSGEQHEQLDHDRSQRPIRAVSVSVDRSIRILALLSILLLAQKISPVSSMAAYPLCTQHNQPHPSDPYPILLCPHGDENCHYLSHKSDGRTVIRDEEGWYNYAIRGVNETLISSGVRVGDPRPKANKAKYWIPPGILPPCMGGKKQTIKDDDDTILIGPRGRAKKSKHYKGRYRYLVCPVRFADHATQRRPVPTRRQLDILYNSDKRHLQLAPTGSLRTMFEVNSHGNFELKSVIAPWIDLPHPEKYYAGRDVGKANSEAMNELIHYVLDQLDADPSFTFASGGRGPYIGINILMSGYGAEFGGTDCHTEATSEDRLWSHQWQVQPWTSTVEKGYSFEKYTLNSAFWGTCGQNLQRVVPLFHEACHLIGLADLYSISSSGFAGVGAWDVMGDAYGFDRRGQVGMLSAYSRIKLGWCKPTVIKANGIYMLEPSVTSCQIFKIDVGFPKSKDEYFLVESRKPIDFDGSVPEGGGLAVWHIDKRRRYDSEDKYPGKAGWPAKHSRVVLMQADGEHGLQSGDIGGAGDLFVEGQSLLPGKAQNPAVHPNSDSYMRGKIRSTGIEITNIRAKGDLMEFEFFSPLLAYSSLPCNVNLKISCTMAIDGTPCQDFKQDYSRSDCSHAVDYALTSENTGSANEIISYMSWSIDGAEQEVSQNVDILAGETISLKTRETVSFCSNVVHFSSARAMLPWQEDQDCHAAASYTFETHDVLTPLCYKSPADKPFETDMGTCSSYADGHINHKYCHADKDKKGIFAHEACPECGRCSSFCLLHAAGAAFDAGYGDCSSYSRENVSSNYAYCDTDTNDDGIVAEDICAECGKCRQIEYE